MPIRVNISVVPFNFLVKGTTLPMVVFDVLIHIKWVVPQVHTWMPLCVFKRINCLIVKDF